MTRVLFCGGRDFSNVQAIKDAFDVLKPSFVITGGATGADSLADKEAEGRGIPRAVYPANWRGEGKAAGPKRNARMLREGRPDLVAAFNGGRGTENMIKQAKIAGVPVRHSQS